MNTTHTLRLRPTMMALALLAAYAPVHADDEVAAYITPSSWVSVGVAGVDGSQKDRALFGQYNGLRNGSAFALVDFEYLRREEQTGTWSILQGQDLGLDTRELHLLYGQQGNWKASADYSELTRVYPRTINTAMGNFGAPNPVVTRLTVQGTGRDEDLETTRRAASLGFEKWITPRLQLEATFKQENKDGARIFGRGFNCSAAFGCVNGGGTSPNTAGAILLLPEPIDSTTRQVETRVNYSMDNLFLSAGYYGSFYTNDNQTMRPTFAGLLWNPNGSSLNPAVVGGNNLAGLGLMGSPIGLPPSNEAHQLYLAGNYKFSPSTRATFRLARTHAIQNENFAEQGFLVMPAGVTSLDGRIDTTNVQLGVTSRPMPKLFLLANVRHEDKQDKTPLRFYSPTPGNTQTDSSMKKSNGKIEGAYSLTNSYKAVLGFDYDEINRGLPANTFDPGGITLIREETREKGVRAEIRRSMGETLNGSLSYTKSKRDGSGWRNALIQGTPPVTDAQAAALGSNRPVTPTMFMDRDREKVKLTADWTPIDRLSLQFLAEDANDDYSDAPGVGTRKGLEKAGALMYSIDASLALNDVWKLNSYVSRNRQVQHINHSLYLAVLTSKSDAAGLGVTGKFGKLDVGAELSYLDDDNDYHQDVETLANTPATVATNQAFLAAQGGLPNVRYRASSVKMFGRYNLDKHATLHVGLTHVRARLNEWTWGNNGVPFFFSDFTTVSMLQHQTVSVFSVNYGYKF